MSNDTTQEIPYGYCHCGCGQKTTIAKINRTARGWVKGQPLNYIAGHSAPPRKRLGPNNHTPTREEYFWQRVDKRGPDDCWEWTSYTKNRGYGVMQLNSPKGWIYAHRFSYELHNGPLGEGLEACHECDNPKCCNPKHLFAGTHADNMQDMTKKGRHWRKRKQSHIDPQGRKET